MRHRGGDPAQAAAQKGSLAQTFKAVAWSFFGVRRARDYESDVASLKPVHVLVAGVISASVFVLALVVLVNWVVDSGVAG